MDNKEPCSSRISEIIFAEASAGSGKTFALAKRYLELLFTNCPAGQIPLRNILAITFTNKATVEMKERILEFLKRIAFDTFENPEQEKEIFSALGVERNFAKNKASSIIDTLIEHYNFFQVQTIDSFINALLLGSALNIDRSASFKIKTDYSQYLSYCLDLVIEEAATNSHVYDFFEEFLEHYLSVQNRTGWFPKDDILKFIDSLFSLTNKYGFNFVLFPGEGADVVKNKKHLYARIEELAKNFPDGFNASRAKSICSFLEKNDAVFDTAGIPAAFVASQVPMNKNKEAPAQFSKQWVAINHKLIETLELDAAIFYNPYIKLLAFIFGFFQTVSKKEDILFLGELNHKARLLFGEEGITVAELYYRLATRFHHYLIDEFQDTSNLQWRNLQTMVEEALSTGGSLFCVGDKKQAIYRFRGGEAELFEQVKQEFSHYNVSLKNLSKNWRSQKTIVDFNNQVFSQENLSAALSVSQITEKLSDAPGEVKQILEVFKDATQQACPENRHGYVYVERIEEKNKEERDQIMQPKIVALLHSLTENNRFAYDDIAILARDNDEVESVTSWLLTSGIPVESEKTLNVLENPLIREVISFLKFLHSPVDDLSFAAFILGEIFSKSCSVSNTEITEFIFNVHKDALRNSDASLYRLFRQRYTAIWESHMEDFFKTVGFISPYELTAAIFSTFEVYKNFSQAQGFFMKFLELIKRTEDEYTGLEDFLGYLNQAQLEDLYVTVTEGKAVKVLTIHKAKGLEFPVVIIPFLRMEINPETVGKGTSSYVMENERRLVRITEKHREFSLPLARIYSQNYRKACIDEFNALYVALTRPQHELYVFVPAKSDNEKNKARFLIPEHIRELGKKMTYERKAKDKQPLIRIESSTYKDWIMSLKDEFGDINYIRNREKILDGTILHTFLSKIPNCAHEDLEALLHEATEFTKTKFPQLRDISGYRKRIEALIHKKELKDIFYCTAAKIFCEKDVVNAFGDLKRIDRLILREQEAWVIDYKSSALEKETHSLQVAQYMQIVEQIYPGKRIKGFLLYLDELRMEEVV
ncbi:MAG: UvrD-helicase domain-containing protein [Candidatus Omnitrophica bacterium]|nr:UvrD-helicase domain-containing protein [Candidatus Omnitrophota bacterium]